MSRGSRARRVVLSAALATVACAAPPNREIVDAEDALKVAKAAGAEHYAPESYKQAADAYRLANEAVTAGDYRLALSDALKSRESSQAATRESADVHARAREDALKIMADVATLLAHAYAELDAAERRRVPRPLVREVRQTLTAVDSDVQKASAAIGKQDFGGAKSTLTDVKARLDKALASLAGNRAVQPAKRTRS